MTLLCLKSVTMFEAKKQRETYTFKAVLTNNLTKTTQTN